MSIDGAKSVGGRLRTFRERLGLTGEALAAATGVGESVIVAVEAGEVYPALGVLVKLARGLGQRLGTFMDDQFTPDPVINRVGERTRAAVSHKECVSEGFHYFPLGSGKHDRHMEPFYIEIEAQAQPHLSSHEGEEFIVVASGEVELVYGSAKHVLKTGDSMYYNSIVPHAVKAANGQPATIQAVVFMPM